MLLICSMFVLPTFAAGRDTTYYISNITIPAFQGWGEARIYDNSYGPYLLVKLNRTVNVDDKIVFVGACEGAHISEEGLATEGAATYTKVKYTDGRNDVGRWLTGIKMRSSYMNSGSYSVNGEAIY